MSFKNRLPRALPKRRHRFFFAGGMVELDGLDGAPLAICPIEGKRHAPRSFLLDEKFPWFQPPHRWGRGFLLLAAQRAVKWGQPTEISVSTSQVKLRYLLDEGVALTVTRRFSRRWNETYTWHNTGVAPLEVTSLAVRIPFRDVYSSAASSLRECCHTHVFPGGAYGFVWAQPMDGIGPGLGLRITAGEMWAYSIEGRNQHSSSNFRGHLLVHATDAARAPLAFGGQPTLVIEPGESYTLAWEIAFYADWAAFAKRLALPVKPATVSAAQGQPIRLRLAKGASIDRSPGVGIRAESEVPGVCQAVCQRIGEHYVPITAPRGRTRIALQWHLPVRRIVERRIDFILTRQRASERAAPRDAAFLPYDTTSGLRIDGGDWQDWSDARERLAMPILLQHARRLGWHRADVLDAALAAYARFALAHLLGPEGQAWENSYEANPDRLYNYPWLAGFFFNQFQHTHAVVDLRRAATIIQAYYRARGACYLAFWDNIPLEVAAALRARGDLPAARRIEAAYLEHADTFLQLAANLPGHEVNYEQSMVAPLAMLFLGAHRLSGDPRYAERLREVLTWLEAFAGQQPHCRLRSVPIRHWDGFWFGRERLWGDVFPHYWSVLSASVFLRAGAFFPDCRNHYRQLAEDVYRANLLHYADDGGATCAFIFPSAVDGRSAHRSDPLANDQDWALVWLLNDMARPEADALVPLE